MDTTAFTDPSGELVTRRPLGGGQYVAFVPSPLPPPPDVEQAAIAANGVLLADAEYNLGLLAGLGGMVREADALATLYLRQEAVRSSQIEGTRTTLLELAAIEALGGPLPSDNDARETLNHVTALEYGLSRVRDGAPIDAELVLDLHRKLMVGTRGKATAGPGRFRDVQNYITAGGPAIYTPPPPAEMRERLASLFHYIETPGGTPPLVEVAWVHYAFEAIHPFRDGNGRVGRILIPLLLARRGRLQPPWLYLAAYFHEHRQEYYDRILAVSARSDWTAWLAFVLRAVASQARTSVDIAQRLMALEEEWIGRLERVGATPTAIRLARLIQRSGFAVDASLAGRALADAGSPVSPPTVYQAIAALARAGILEEVTGRARGRVWAALELVRLLDSTEDRGAPTDDAGESAPP